MSPQEQLRLQITDTFNLDEIKLLCLDLSLRYDDLPGDTLSLKVGALLIATYRLSQLSTLHAYLVRNRPNTEWLPLDQLEALNWADLADTFSFPAAIENQIQQQINAQSVQGDLAGRDVNKRDTNTAGRDIHIKNVGEEHHHHHGGQQIDPEAMWEAR